MVPKKKFIVLCTPSLGAVSLWWAKAVADLMWPLCMGKRIEFLQDTVGDEIAESRNRLVTKALSFDAEDREVSHLAWLDDDVIPSRSAFVRMYEHHRDIVSGCYFTKGEPSQPLIFPGLGQGTAQFVPDQVLEVWGHGMGLCLVKADVYRRMAAELQLPRDKYGCMEWYKTNRQYRLEGNVLDCGGTEDLHFLNNAGKLGYRPLMDTHKWAFGWHFDLRRGRGYPEAQWNQYAAGKPPVWQTPTGPVQWE